MGETTVPLSLVDSLLMEFGSGLSSFLNVRSILSMMSAGTVSVSICHAESVVSGDGDLLCALETCNTSLMFTDLKLTIEITLCPTMYFYVQHRVIGKERSSGQSSVFHVLCNMYGHLYLLFYLKLSGIRP